MRDAFLNGIGERTLHCLFPPHAAPRRQTYCYRCLPMQGCMVRGWQSTGWLAFYSADEHRRLLGSTLPAIARLPPCVWIRNVAPCHHGANCRVVGADRGSCVSAHECVPSNHHHDSTSRARRQPRPCLVPPWPGCPFHLRRFTRHVDAAGLCASLPPAEAVMTGCRAAVGSCVVIGLGSWCVALLRSHHCRRNRMRTPELSTGLGAHCGRSRPHGCSPYTSPCALRREYCKWNHTRQIEAVKAQVDMLNRDAKIAADAQRAAAKSDCGDCDK